MEEEREVRFSFLPLRDIPLFLLSRPKCLDQLAQKRLVRRLNNYIFFVAEKHTV